ncbi:MAG: hypothetical protein V1875_09950 [Candidatus Altiarchaeota archaeon]
MVSCFHEHHDHVLEHNDLLLRVDVVHDVTTWSTTTTSVTTTSTSTTLAPIELATTSTISLKCGGLYQRACQGGKCSHGLAPGANNLCRPSKSASKGPNPFLDKWT